MLALVVDTNLFHEFRKLETLPWDEMTEAGEITLIVSDPVQTELDEQKKSSRARIKRRALDWVKRFRALLKAGETDLVLREDKPRVILRLDDTRPSKSHDDVLDLSVPDDCIVAIAASHKHSGDYERLAVFSDDLRPMRKARLVGLEFIEIPEDWRREPEQTDDDKERLRLRDEITLLKRQEPELHLTGSINSPADFVLPFFEPLTDGQLEGLMQIIQERHPIETNFERARTSALNRSMQTGMIGLSRREFRNASESDIEQYREDSYPAWLIKCQKQLSSAHEHLNLQAQQLTLEIELENRGTRPANDLQITFSAKGDAEIMPDPSDLMDYEEDDEETPKQAGFNLLKPPTAPQGKWITVDPFGGMLGRHFSDPDRFLTPYMGPTLPDILRDNERDPNRFYYRNRPSAPVGTYSLTCKQYRHAEGAQTFNVLVRPRGDDSLHLDGKSAMIEVACNASNLSFVEPLRISLKIKVEVKSTFDALRPKLTPLQFVVSNKISGGDE